MLRAPRCGAVRRAPAGAAGNGVKVRASFPLGSSLPPLVRRLVFSLPLVLCLRPLLHLRFLSYFLVLLLFLFPFPFLFVFSTLLSFPLLLPLCSLSPRHLTPNDHAALMNSCTLLCTSVRDSTVWMGYYCSRWSHLPAKVGSHISVEELEDSQYVAACLCIPLRY